MNSPFQNIVTTLTNESKPSSGSWIWLLLMVMLLFIGIGIWYWMRWKTSPWLADRLTADQHIFDFLKPIGQEIQPGTFPEKTPEPEHPPYKKETWCFVGEDKTGRWCVKVPTDHACDPDRTFSTRSDCEIVTASAMPLGFLKYGGASDTPLSAIPAMSNTQVV
jgi:hypothetical protein